MNDQQIYEQVERMAALYQWEDVAIWVGREPCGVYEFTATLSGNRKIGTSFACVAGKSPAEAVDTLIARVGDRDPEIVRQKRSRELELELARLKTVTVALPPYRAPNQIGFGVRPDSAPPTPAVINVEVEVKDDVPF